MAEAIEATCRPPCGRPTTILSLRIPGNIQDWTEDKRDQIKRLLQDLGFTDAEIIHVESGSIKLTLRLPSKQAERLFWAANSGELQSLGKVACKYAPNQDQGSALVLPEEVKPQPSARCSLLVVDDEPMILSMLVRLFSHDYEVLTAASAAAAQRILEQRAVDLILTEPAACRSGRASNCSSGCASTTPRTVRLLMTGQAELDDAIEAINRGQVYQLPPEKLADRGVGRGSCATLPRNVSWSNATTPCWPNSNSVSTSAHANSSRPTNNSGTGPASWNASSWSIA